MTAAYLALGGWLLAVVLAVLGISVGVRHDRDRMFHPTSRAVEDNAAPPASPAQHRPVGTADHTAPTGHRWAAP